VRGGTFPYDEPTAPRTRPESSRMKLAVRSAAATVAAVTTAGVSTLAFGATPAFAAPSEACGPTGTLVGPGVCEEVLTASGDFTPTAQMTKLEVLLVGGGGTGNNISGTDGYASAGGGGEVRVLDISGAASVITVSVGGAGSSSSLSGGATGSVSAGGAGGYDNTTNTANGGASGNGQAGASNSAAVGVDPYAGGGGNGAPGSGANGGVGITADAAAAAITDSLFAGDTRCFGGGGAAGVSGVGGVAAVCGGGGAPVDTTGGAVSDPVPNSGGGGAATPADVSSGASGVAIFRWTAANVTLNFSANGHGTAPAPQVVPAGAAASKPADPTATGYQFEGWFTDASLTTPADFSAGVTASTTYYAKWVAALAPTGSEPSVVALGGAIAALVAGAGILAVARRRRPTTD